MADSWVEKIVNLKANVVQEVSSDFGRPVNTFIVKNLTQYAVYGSLKSTLTTTDYEIQVQPGDYGMIVRPHEFQKIYLLSTADITLTVYLVWTQNPMILIPSMAKPLQSTNVNVTGTVGLQPGNLHIEEETKDLVVKLQDNDITGNLLSNMLVNGLNIDGLNIESVSYESNTESNNYKDGNTETGNTTTDNTNVRNTVSDNVISGNIISNIVLEDYLDTIGKNVRTVVNNDLNMAGVNAQKVTAAAAGDITVKSAAGKVYAIRAGTGPNVTLKDNTTEKWYIPSGSKDEFYQPINCGTSIVLNFSAAGDAWILYL